MVEEQHQRGAWVRYWPLVAVAVGGLVLGCVLVFPRLLYPPLSSTELQVRGVRNPKDRVQLQNDRLKLQNDARTTLLQAVGGLLVLSTAAAGAYTAWRQLQDNQHQQARNERLTREELRLTRESHIADRFTKAVEQLGNDSLDVRLGGIYALERIAADSERDHPTVVEVLTGFVREASRRRRTPSPTEETVQATAQGPATVAPKSNAKPQPATDVQAALTVLGRLPQRPGVPRGDLSSAQVAGAQLNRANLSGAWLRGADLSGAQLNQANLSGAWLAVANLSGAQLSGADLSGAQFSGVDLSGAQLERANLSGAELFEANLYGAKLERANLSRAVLLEADLSYAWLPGADLSGADLGGANLSSAKSLWQSQLDAARGDSDTRLPERLQRPDSW
jgi:uncharacterized protein YjbI with pentapeptide repeats